MSQYKEMNEAYGNHFGGDYYPARTTIQVVGLPRGENLEVSCIAYADRSKISVVMPPAGALPPAAGLYRPPFGPDTSNAAVPRARVTCT